MLQLLEIQCIHIFNIVLYQRISLLISGFFKGGVHCATKHWCVGYTFNITWIFILFRICLLHKSPFQFSPQYFINLSFIPRVDCWIQELRLRDFRLILLQFKGFPLAFPVNVLKVELNFVFQYHFIINQPFSSDLLFCSFVITILTT